MKKENFQRIKTHHKKFCYVFAIILSVFLLALTASVAVGIVNKIKEGKYIGQSIGGPNTISVSEKGEIFAKPDLAIVDFSVIIEAKTVAAAMAENAEKMNKVIASLKEQDVDEKDLKTVYFNLSPRYEYQEEESYYSSGERILVGYEVIQSLQVKIRDLTKIGTIIEKATESGANQLSDLQLTIDDQEVLKEQARVQAIEKAKTKAEKLASQIGVKLVKIINFYEEVPYFYGFEESEAKGLGGGSVSALPDVQAGQNKITVTVTITYEIK